MPFPLLENLETRRLLANIVVNTLGDAASDGDGSTDGQISLREAIIAANTNAAFGDANAALGTDFLTYPQARTVQIGLNLGF